MSALITWLLEEGLDLERLGLLIAAYTHEQYRPLHSRKGTPMAHIIDVGTPLRARLEAGETLDMDDLAQLQSQGMTDFLAWPIRCGGALLAGMTITALGPVSKRLIPRFEQRALLKTHSSATHTASRA